MFARPPTLNLLIPQAENKDLRLGKQISLEFQAFFFSRGHEWSGSKQRCNYCEGVIVSVLTGTAGPCPERLLGEERRRTCPRPCKTDKDCGNKRQCLCDGQCGLSCVAPGNCVCVCGLSHCANYLCVCNLHVYVFMQLCLHASVCAHRNCVFLLNSKCALC